MARIPIIIDTDPGVDDITAILYALASNELEILAIIVSFGNTDVESSFCNILKLFNALALHFDRFPEDRMRFPNFSSRPILAKGPDGPLEGDLHSAQYFHGRDGLGDISERHPDINIGSGEKFLQVILDRPGYEVALELIRSRPARSITYVALGPLTNLALMTRHDPEACSNLLGRVVSMGGALDVPGNTSPVAEYPYAVKELLIDNGLPLERFVLLPLDITTPHELSFPLYKTHVDPSFTNSSLPSNPLEKSPLLHFTSSFFERTREIMLEFGKDAMELHDVVAMWCAANNPPNAVEDGTLPGLSEGWTVVHRLFQIERTGELTRGMCVVDRRDETTNYQPGDNRAEVQAALERALHMPAPIQVESSSVIAIQPKGIACVVQTPGPASLVNSMISKIWGIKT